MTLTRWIIVGVGIVAFCALLLSLFLLYKLSLLGERKAKDINRDKELSGSESWTRYPKNNYWGSDATPKTNLINLIRNERDVKSCIKDLAREVCEEMLNKREKCIQDEKKKDGQNVVKNDLEKEEHEIVVNTSNVQAHSIKEDKKIYYASALEADNKTFCEVSESADSNEIIFLFTEEKNGRCRYTIDHRAYSKILKDDSFLTGACRLTKKGTSNSTVRVIQEGVAEKTVDGKWIVKEQAKVDFE